MAATRAVLAAVRDGKVKQADLIAMVDGVNVTRLRDTFDEQPQNRAEQVVAEAVAARGWQVRQDAPALGRLADICAMAQLLEVDELCVALQRYAEAADQLVACDAAVVSALTARLADDGVTQREALILATVLGGALQSALRSLALENALARLQPTNAD
jgi:hypothetical protein